MPVYRYVGLPVLLAKAEAAALLTVNQGANYLVQMAQQELAPHTKTGALAASVHTEGGRLTGHGAEAIVSTGAEVDDYALAQHKGAGPHVIRAKNAKALYWPGAAHPVRQVNHPGNPALKFISNPLLQMRAQYVAFARAAMKGQF